MADCGLFLLPVSDRLSTAINNAICADDMQRINTSGKYSEVCVQCGAARDSSLCFATWHRASADCSTLWQRHLVVWTSDRRPQRRQQFPQ